MTKKILATYRGCENNHIHCFDIINDDNKKTKVEIGLVFSGDEVYSAFRKIDKKFIPIQVTTWMEEIAKDAYENQLESSTGIGSKYKFKFEEATLTSSRIIRKKGTNGPNYENTRVTYGTFFNKKLDEIAFGPCNAYFKDKKNNSTTANFFLCIASMAGTGGTLLCAGLLYILARLSQPFALLGAWGLDVLDNAFSEENKASNSL